MRVLATLATNILNTSRNIRSSLIALGQFNSEVEGDTSDVFNLDRDGTKLADCATAIQSIQRRPDSLAGPDVNISLGDTISIPEKTFFPEAVTISSESATLNADPSTILNGETVSIQGSTGIIQSVTGTLVVQNFYMGNSIPEDSYGDDNDFYFVV